MVKPGDLIVLSAQQIREGGLAVFDDSAPDTDNVALFVDNDIAFVTNVSAAIPVVTFSGDPVYDISFILRATQCSVRFVSMKRMLEMFDVVTHAGATSTKR